jgi:hypothetical protein
MRYLILFVSFSDATWKSFRNIKTEWATIQKCEWRKAEAYAS